jgi:hypothetical protein
MVFPLALRQVFEPLPCVGKCVGSVERVRSESLQLVYQFFQFGPHILRLRVQLINALVSLGLCLGGHCFSFGQLMLGWRVFVADQSHALRGTPETKRHLDVSLFINSMT